MLTSSPGLTAGDVAGALALQSLALLCGLSR
jgi:hypothetical protein